MVTFCKFLVVFSLFCCVASTVSNYPHQLAYFNEAAGGVENGYRHLLHSSFDWGQDLLEVNRAAAAGLIEAPVGIAYAGPMRPFCLDIPAHPADLQSEVICNSKCRSLAISAHALMISDSEHASGRENYRNRGDPCNCFEGFTYLGRAGASIFLYGRK